ATVSNALRIVARLFPPGSPRKVVAPRMSPVLGGFEGRPQAGPRRPTPSRAGRRGSVRRPTEAAPTGAGLLQQARQATVGQRLAASLAGGAVLERGVSEGDLANRVAADWAGLTSLAVHAQAGLLLALEVRRRQARRALYRVPERAHDRGVQRGDLIGREAGRELVRRHLGRVQHLVR